MLNSLSGSDVQETVVVVARSREDLYLALGANRELFHDARVLAKPSFFLASLSTVWQPRVAAVLRAGEPVGLLYARERTILGLGTGILHLDTTLGSTWLKNGQDPEEILSLALAALLANRGVRGLRLLASPRSVEFEVARRMAAQERLDIAEANAPVQHRSLRLSESYAEFLDNLGKRTRRNFRYYRKKFEADGHSFCKIETKEDFLSAARSLLTENVVGMDSVDIARFAQLLEVLPAPLLVGLRTKDAKWLSVLGGWYEKTQAIAFLQINSDQHHSHYSLSTVLRGCLCERLLDEGVREVIFWGGVVGALNKYSDLIPGVCIYLDKRNWLWHAFRQMLSVLTRAFPGRLKSCARWIVPERGAISAIPAHTELCENGHDD